MSADRVLRRLALDPTKVDRGVDAARREGVPLARWLVDSGWLAGDAWAREAAAELGLEYREQLGPVDASLRERWPVAFFRSHQATPIALRDGKLDVAVWDPTDRDNLEAIEAFVRMPVRAVCAPPNAIQLRNAPAAGESAADAAAALELDAPQSEPHLRLLHEILRGAVKRGATDVHVAAEPGLVARLRVDGLLGPGLWTADAAVSGSLLNRVRVLAGVDVTETRVPQDGSFRLRTQGRAVDVRVSILPTGAGSSVVLRLLDRERLGGAALTLERLGYRAPEREAMLSAARRPHGLLLLVGPTGSGKSTTLYAALREAADAARKLVTIEDPIEYRLDGAVQVEVNDAIGLSFATGLRSILRHDPDRILVGEIRDAETARIAVQAALTGHLVLSTLHATTAELVSRRMAALDVDADALADTLSLLASQRLVRATCPPCGGRGCPDCDGTGQRGRVALAEVSVRAGGTLEPVRPIRDVAREMLDAKVTTRAEIERVWPEAVE